MSPTHAVFTLTMISVVALGFLMATVTDSNAGVSIGIGFGLPGFYGYPYGYGYYPYPYPYYAPGYYSVGYRPYYWWHGRRVYYHRHHRYCRMRGDHPLQFSRINIVTRRENHIFLAVYDVDITLHINACQVARI